MSQAQANRRTLIAAIVVSLIIGIVIGYAFEYYQSTLPLKSELESTKADLDSLVSKLKGEVLPKLKEGAVNETLKILEELVKG